MSAPLTPLPQDPAHTAPGGWLLACLCAGWCRTCDDYQAVLRDAAARLPGWCVAWIDIEDHADALDDADGAAEDIQNFPTLLLAHDDVPMFFGTVLPQPGVLQRLLEQAQAGALPALADPTARRFALAITELWQRAAPGVRVGA